MQVARSSLHYESRLVARDAPALAAMSSLSAQYPRYGYRRIQVFMARDGHVMNASVLAAQCKVGGVRCAVCGVRLCDCVQKSFGGVGRGCKFGGS